MDPKYVYFDYLWHHYRTTRDASIVEALDGKRWTKTGSLRVILEALRRVGATQPPGQMLLI